MGWRASMASDWHKLARLSHAERVLLFQAAVLIPLVAVAQRLISLKRLHAGLLRISKTAPGVRNGYGHAISANKIARLVQVAARRGVTQPSCLPRALVLWALLRRQGFPAEICFGVRREAGRFEAHAWVTHQGNVLNDAHDVGDRFAPFPAAILPAG